jgi:hypothetical protein
MTAPSRLRAVPRLAGRSTYEFRFDVASQVMVAGTQDVFVQPIVPLSGPGKGQIGIRVGRLLVYVSNREALQSFLDAWAQAEELADKAFGPELPPPRIGDDEAAGHG